MLSSFGRHFSSASLLASPILIFSSFLTSTVYAPCQPNPGSRPPAKPYTAEFKTTSVRTLVNGTNIRQEIKSVQARDSQWRTFSQTENDFWSDRGNAPIYISGTISDPVAGTDTSWQSRTHEAITTKYPPPDQRHGCWADETGRRRAAYDPIRLPAQPISANGAPPPRPPQPDDLGMTMMEGVEVKGRRFTETIPAGQIGNDKPIIITNEVWTAPSLGGLLVRSVSEDPRSGKSTKEITRLDLSEPDPTLFQPPQGYEVKIRELHQVACDQNQR